MQKRPSARQVCAGGTAIGSPSAVVLVGFMGAGKTSVGRIMAEQLGWRFTDLDERIEHRHGRSIASIFRQSGEAAFRKLEHSELRRLVSEARSGAGLIAALGGGTLSQLPNSALLRKYKFPIIFLDAPLETLRRRCLRHARLTGKQRPLLGTMAEFRSRYTARRPSYSQAQLRVDTAARRTHAIALEICTTLRLAPLRQD